MQGPFNGKFLRVDLTKGTTTVGEVPALTYRMYLGGAAMVAYLLNRELKPGVDPLGPDNVLVFATCPANGAPISGTTRFSAAAKSPLTGGVRRGGGGRLVGAGTQARRR
jgi:aldehyde:ferredoxin oxidoreductase